MSAESTESPLRLVSESGRRRLEDRVRQLEARLAELRGALEEAERGREILQEQLRVAEERDRILAVLHSSGRVVDCSDDPGVVEVGDTVGLLFDDGTEERHMLVHGLEVGIDDRRISSASPLGRAILGRRVGDTVSVRAPSGPYRCTVTAASRT